MQVSQGEMHAAKQQQSLSSLQLPGADGRLVNDFSDLGSDMRSRKSDAKSPRSSQGRSSKRKVGKSKRKKEGEERGEEYEVIFPTYAYQSSQMLSPGNLPPS